MTMSRRLWVLGLMLAGALAAKAATSQPADPCSLLPAADVSKVFGDNYAAPTSSVAPRPFPNTVQGTDCHYQSGRHEVLLRIYFDPSPSAATELFTRLKMYYSPPQPAPGVGDEAYFDPNHALHVRKGNVRYFVDGPNDPAKLTALGQKVAGKL